MFAQLVLILAGTSTLIHGKHFLIETEDTDDVRSQDTSNTNDYEDETVSADGKLRKQTVVPPLFSFITATRWKYNALFSYKLTELHRKIVNRAAK